MSEFIENQISPYFNFWIYVILMMIGLWAVIAKRNLIKKLIGLSIFQTAIILFYVSIGVKEGATIPILDHHGPAHHEETEEKADHGKPAPGHVAQNGAHHEHGETHDDPHHGGKHHAIDPDTMANPLPHVLMLTAIVVGVSTLGVALAISQMIYKEFGTLEEDEILEKLKTEPLHD